MHTSPTIWAVTLAFAALLVAVDIFIHRNVEEVTLRRAAIITTIWTVIGLGFTGFVLLEYGGDAAGQYFTGYLLERAMSVDNVFVFVVILGFFAVPPVAQHRALVFGVLAAIVMRAIFIFGGLALLERFEWLTYPFGVLLLFTAWKLFFSGEEEVDPNRNIALRGLRKLIRMQPDFEGHRVWLRRDHVLIATPLLAVLIVIGTTDLVFAIDSIPAIFSVTRDSYLVFTSNLFAVLGLYALTFLLAGVMDRFEYLKHALAIVLALVGAKMIAHHWVDVNTWLSLGIIVAILGAGMAYSLVATKDRPHHVDNPLD